MPIACPQTDTEIIQAIQLYRSPRIGPVAYAKLQDQCEDFGEALERVIKQTRDMGISDYELCRFDVARAEFERGREFGAHFLHNLSDEYPQLLKDTDNAPPFLWAKGDLELLKRRTLAIIGTRNPTLEGVRMTLHLSKLCNYEDIVVVSGLARGIDAAAHEAAVTGGTIGVVAGGVDVNYPRSNAELQEIMCEHGLVVSEMPFGYQPVARDFPKRNRIIAGLSLGVLVIEGNLRSGTRLTVQDAQNYGREVMAVPGHPFSGLAALPNELISEGAGVVRDIDDVLAILNFGYRSEYYVKSEDSDGEIDYERESDDRDAGYSAASLGRALIEGRAVDRLDGEIRAV